MSAPLLIAATSRDAAERYLARTDRRAEIVDRFDLAAARGRLQPRGRTVILHSVDWAREDMPQLYLLALARSGVRRALLVDESGATPELELSRRRMLAAAAAAPVELAAGLVTAGVEAARGLRRTPSRRPEPGRFASVAVVWPGGAQTRVGGSVTHVAGIVGAFAARGLEVVVISEADPPAQIAATATGIEVIPPLPARSRGTRDVRRLTANRPMRAALGRVLDRLDAPFVYSRHQALATAPAEVALGRGLPLVLEWNASERWAHEHWTRSPGPVKRLSLPLIGSLERRVVGAASVVAAVSAPAASMALASGADPGTVLLVPNGVDPEEVDRLAAGAAPSGDPGPVVGWIGSFGEWHGAEVAIRSLALLAPPVRLRMIGDGVEREACELLAEDLGVGERVQFTGRLPHPEAVRALAECDVLVSPHVPLRTGEPFFGSPTKLFEYMALRRPIVASDLGQIGEVLDDGRSAILVEPGSVDGLAAGVGRLLADSELAARLARNARIAVESEHSWLARGDAILSALADGGLDG